MGHVQGGYDSGMRSELGLILHSGDGVVYWL